MPLLNDPHDGFAKNVQRRKQTNQDHQVLAQQEQTKKDTSKKKQIADGFVSTGL